MISNQILQSTIDGLKNITRKELSVIEKEGKVIATTEENMIGRQVDAVENFVGSQAESQLIMGYQYFKIYDNGVPEHAVAEIQALLGQESLVIQKKSKKSKKGYTEIDLIPMIHLWEMTPEAGCITVHARLMAQNPGLNPSIVIDTIRNLRPDAAPDFVRYHRNEIYDGEGKVFR